MINTSMAYKRAIQKNREFSVRDKYVFADGSEPDMSTTDFMAYSINEATSESGKFSIGAAVIKKYTATLNNENDKFSGYNFEGCDISARVGLKLEDGTVEVLQKGRYRIVSAKASNMTVSVEGYDSMLFFDRPYSESTLVYPATISEIVRDACAHCQVAYDISTLPWPDYTVQQKPSGDALTFRDVISCCAQIQCCYAKINNLDQLIFGWYDFDAFGDGDLDGGMFDTESEDAYLSGDSADGGTFDDYSAGYSFDAGTFDDMSNYHHIFLLGSQSINTDDITITGVRVSAVLDNSDQTESYVCGMDGYMLSIEENPLIQSGQAQSVAEYIGSKMVGKTFRPMSVTCQSDPCMEAGDSAIVTDRKQNSYQTVITNTTFAIGAMQQITCDAETPTEKNYTKFGASTKLLDKSRKETQKQLTTYDLAASQLGALMAHSMGMYETREVDPDTGAEIKYMHDKPSLEESETIWKQTVDAFAVSTDGGESWNAGIDASGNVLAKVLSVIGLNADWINAGTITGITYKDAKGYLEIKNGSMGSKTRNLTATYANGMIVLMDETPYGESTSYFGGVRIENKHRLGPSTGYRAQFECNNLYFSRAEYKEDGSVLYPILFSIDCELNRLYAEEFEAIFSSVVAKNVTQTSDVRLKNIAHEIRSQEAEKIIKNLRTIAFSWKNGNEELHYGLDADNVENAIGKGFGTVRKSKDGLKSVAYTEMIPVLVSALQGCFDKIEKLEKKISELEEK